MSRNFGVLGTLIEPACFLISCEDMGSGDLVTRSGILGDGAAEREESPTPSLCGATKGISRLLITTLFMDIYHRV